MKQIDLTVNLEETPLSSESKNILSEVLKFRNEAGEFIKEEKYLEAMDRTVSGLKMLRDFPDPKNSVFRILLVALIFDLAEIHYCLKNYKQSEKELEALFKLLDILIKTNEELFGQYHILAMELTTRIIRSRKKALDLLMKQQLTTEALYEKVNSGVAAATNKLVESLCKTAQLLAATGNIRGSIRFYAEAIKYSKKRTGRVTPKEISISIEMAEVMMRMRTMLPRAKRLLETLEPHAQAVGMKKEQEDIHSLIDVIEKMEEPESKWRLFMRTFFKI